MSKQKHVGHTAEHAVQARQRPPSSSQYGSLWNASMSMATSWMSGMSPLNASWRRLVAWRNSMRSSSVATRGLHAASRMFAASTLEMLTRYLPPISCRNRS